MARAPGQGKELNYVERSGTVLETDEDLRQALLAGLKGSTQAAPVEPKPSPSPGPAPVPARTASPFRPTARPPVPILTICDDGKPDGEVIRLREPKFTIGRAEGDLRFPLDGRMSSRHVEIAHQVVGGRHRWVITDLQSTHGLFVRVSRSALADQAEFLVGNGRYRFEGEQADPDATIDHTPEGHDTSATLGWNEGVSPFRPAALTELIGREIGNRVLLLREEYWVGSDPSCAVCRVDDPFCESRHVRIFRNPRGGWQAEHNRTQNGLWLRMSQINADATVHFQAGEQRFKLKVN